MNSSSSSSSFDRIIQHLRNLESRITRIEQHLQIHGDNESLEENLSSISVSESDERTEKLELQIGQYWFAKVGIVALSIGIVFLLLLPYPSLPPIIPSLMGYIIVVVIFALSYFSQKSFSYLSGYLLGGGLILLYFTTLRLHYFSPEPAITNHTFVVILLLLVSISSLVISIQKKSSYLTLVILTFGYVTALVSGNSFSTFFLTSLFAIITSAIKIKFGWNKVFIYGLLLTYFTHLIWFLNNPFLGNKLLVVSEPMFNVFFLLFYVLIFSIGNLFRVKDSKEDSIVIVSAFISGLWGYGLYLANIFLKHQSEAILLNLLAAGIFLAVSIIFWIYERSKYSTFFYAMLGYLALSVAIITAFNKPDYFIWLSWQSLIVISTAVWFRSKFIIVTNFIIFILVFIAYLVVSSDVSLVSIGFGVVALISARLLNWRKNKLELQTEMMRNAYLATAFFIIPYSLYHFVPREYVSLSWIGVTVFYYLLSLILNNKKYRWMAILNLLLTFLYVSLIGITQLTPVFRIISFLALGLVLIVISILYAKKKSKSGNEKSENLDE